MNDKDLNKIMYEYLQSKSGDADEDLKKLVQKPLPEKKEHSASKGIGRPHAYKFAIAAMAAMCVIAIVFAVVFPIAYVNSQNDEPSKGITNVWTVSMAYEAAVQSGYSGSFEEFLKVFSYIDTVSIDDEGNLTLRLADGTQISAGKVEGSFNKGISSVSVSENGDLIISYSDGTIQTIESSVFKGEQGVGIADMYINDEGYMIVILTDGSIINAGAVNAKEKYTLTIDAQGGYIDVDGSGLIEFVDSVKEYESGTYVSLPQISKKMYTFEGWYMVVDGREISVGDGVNVVSDITVIAKWSGGPNYPDYSIPEQYWGVYVDQSNPNITLEVAADKILATIDGVSEYYYPTIIDGKIKIYADNYYIDMLIDVNFGEGVIMMTFGEQVGIYVKVS